VPRGPGIAPGQARLVLDGRQWPSGAPWRAMPAAVTSPPE